VCVVGAGFTGLSAALELAERGFDVVVLEGRRIAWGASGRNGGQFMAGFNAAMSDVEALVGRDDARALWDLNEEGTALLVERIQRHAIACDLVRGQVLAATRRRHLTEAAALAKEMAQDYGYRQATLLDRDGVRRLIGSDAYVGGIFDAGGGHLHPLNYALGLADAAEAAGVRLFEGAPVVEVSTGDRPEAVTAPNPHTPASPHTPNYPAGARVRARFLILAGNAYLAGLAPRLARSIMPVCSTLLATEPLGEAMATRLLPANVAVCDMKFVLNYFRRTADHRLLFGGGLAYSGRDTPGATRRLWRAALAVFPELAGARMDFAWSGHTALTVNRLPHLGRLGPATLFAHGYSGHGITLSGLAGRLMAEAVAGQAGRFDVFARIPHLAFPGGRYSRMPILVLAMLWYRLRDLL
jgi:gamma-glutamylputrescine oxidase